MGYFNVTVKPEIPASLQHASAFSAGDVLFGWVSFEIPKGGAKLIGATMMIRPKGNSSPSHNQFGAYLVFATNDNQTIGTINGGAAKEPSNDFIGFVEFDDHTSFANSMNSTSVAVSGRAASDNAPHPSIVFAREDGSEGQGSSVGYDKFYMRGLANGAIDFTSINGIAEAGAADAASTQVITMDDLSAGTTMDCTEHFIAGDVLHIGTTVGAPAADSLIGTVASVTAQQITLEAVSPTELVDGDVVYNLNPIRILLHFEN